MPRGKKLTADPIIGKLREPELVQAHDDRNVFQASPDELPARGFRVDRQPEDRF